MIGCWSFLVVMEIKIGFVSRDDRESIKLVEELVKHFRSKAKILFDPELAHKIGDSGTPVDDMDVDFIVSVGGDGTLLRTIQKMRDPRPILGINMGTLGFLVDVEPVDAVSTLEHILHGFEVEERPRLKISLNGSDLPPATNEVALITASPAKMLEFEIVVDDSLLERLRADGLLFATSTGSTAYAMSAGGPIVDPRVDAIVLVPMAPFKLSARPWVLPGGSVIKVELVLPGKDALVVIDGQSMASISKDDLITISRAETPARFIKTRENGFYEKVKSKLA
jgi:NAD+ kinase